MMTQGIKAKIAEKIKTNGTGDITASILADVLNTMLENGVFNLDDSYFEGTITEGDAWSLCNNAYDKIIYRTQSTTMVYRKTSDPELRQAAFNNAASMGLNLVLLAVYENGVVYTEEGDLDGFSIIALFQDIDENADYLLRRYEM